MTRSTSSHRLRRAAERGAAGHRDDRLALRQQLRPARHRAQLRHPREYDDTQDAVYTINNIKVSSPDRRRRPVATSDTRQQGGREMHAAADRRPGRDDLAATATYMIAYDVAGAMRTFPSGLRRVLLGRHRHRLERRHQEGRDHRHGARRRPGRQLLRRPGRAARARVRRPRSTPTARRPSPRPTSARARAVTIGVKIKPGLVTDNKPHLEPDGSKLTGGEKIGWPSSARSARRRRSVRRMVGCPLVAQERSGPALRRAGARARCRWPARRPQIVPNDPDMPDPGGVLAAADPGRRGGSADRRAGRHPGDRGDHHRPRRPRCAHGAEPEQGRLPGHPGRPGSRPPRRTRWCC